MMTDSSPRKKPYLRLVDETSITPVRERSIRPVGDMATKTDLELFSARRAAYVAGRI
ncbi:hypothetical protein LCGC14_1917420 [marine sediment metagenome]|uniref:Uncharacterized protein n=1 Tax=marine sediment metagenome TaxID=412755 RepID=A0A0F9GF30_9ZZZZ